jgi:hypothetical protein
MDRLVQLGASAEDNYGSQDLRELFADYGKARISQKCADIRMKLTSELSKLTNLAQKTAVRFFEVWLATLREPKAADYLFREGLADILPVNTMCLLHTRFRRLVFPVSDMPVVLDIPYTRMLKAAQAQYERRDSRTSETAAIMDHMFVWNLVLSSDDLLGVLGSETIGQLVKASDNCMQVTDALSEDDVVFEEPPKQFAKASEALKEHGFKGKFSSEHLECIYREMFKVMHIAATRDNVRCPEMDDLRSLFQKCGVTDYQNFAAQYDKYKDVLKDVAEQWCQRVFVHTAFKLYGNDISIIDPYAPPITPAPKKPKSSGGGSSAPAATAPSKPPSKISEVILKDHSASMIALNRVLEGNNISLMLTDPPWNIMSHAHDKVPLDDVLKVFEAISDDVFSPQAVALIFCDWTMLQGLKEYWERRKWFVMGKMAWVNTASRARNFVKVPNMWRPSRAHTDILFVSRKKLELRTNLGESKDPLRFHDVILRTFAVNEHLKVEPTSKEPVRTEQKPLSVLMEFIWRYTDPKDWVLDPFAGTGSTLCAALRLDRNSIGFETDRLCVDAARDRIEELVQDVSQGKVPVWTKPLDTEAVMSQLNKEKPLTEVQKILQMAEDAEVLEHQEQDDETSEKEEPASSQNVDQVVEEEPDEEFVPREPKRRKH